MSSKMVAAQLNAGGVKAQAFDSWELGFVTTSDFGNAEPLDGSYVAMKKSISALKTVPVITGFIGKTEKGDIATLGRGGSDYSGAIIGAAIYSKNKRSYSRICYVAKFFKHHQVVSHPLRSLHAKNA